MNDSEKGYVKSWGYTIWMRGHSAELLPEGIQHIALIMHMNSVLCPWSCKHGRLWATPLSVISRICACSNWHQMSAYGCIACTCFASVTQKQHSIKFKGKSSSQEVLLIIIRVNMLYVELGLLHLLPISLQAGSAPDSAWGGSRVTPRVSTSTIDIAAKHSPQCAFVMFAHTSPGHVLHIFAACWSGEWL